MEGVHVLCWYFDFILTVTVECSTGDLAKSIRSRTDLHFGLYHSMFEWYNPLYLADKASGFKTRKFVEVRVGIFVYVYRDWYDL
jgi:hypothetical protein